jgi:hypothetical protein
MKTHEFDDSIFYRVACDCTDNEHDVQLELETDELGILMMRMSANLQWASYYANTWYGQIWERIITPIKMLLIGRVEVFHEILFLNEDHIDAFIAAMEEGKEKIKKVISDMHLS